MSKRVPVAALLALIVGCAEPPAESGQSAPVAFTGLELIEQTSNTTALLQAISIVDDRTVWASGHEGTWAVTVNGGRIWDSFVMEGEETLQFRDVEAFSAATAYLMTAGTGDQSRVYRTDDGGQNWRLQYMADHPAAFLDCMAFWDEDRGVVYGDETDGTLFILRTEDGGETWTRLPAAVLPAAQEGEGGFAASGTCLVTGSDGRAWISTGNAEQPRVLMTSDWGASWSAVDLPLIGGTGAGPTTIQIAEDGRGITLGGAIGNDTAWTDNVAVTGDGGASWTLAGRPVMSGPAYGSALVVNGEQTAVVAVGPRGMNWSTDFGTTWQPADTLTYWAVSFAGPESGWAVGPQGRIVRLTLR